ncbi:MAG: O-antigen ligase family protein [Pseudomonadota bacterium]
MTDATFDRPARSQLRITPERRDFIVLTLWITTTFVQFTGDQLLLYPLAAYYAFSIWRDQRTILPIVAGNWVALAFPVWCALSILWALEPEAALKDAVYLFLTILICFQVAATLTLRQIMHAILLATGFVGIINFIYALTVGPVVSGIFVQKNTMGKNMVVLWIVALATALDPQSARTIRLGAVGLAAIAAIMSVLSTSATAILLVLASSLILIVGAISLRGGFFRVDRLFWTFLMVAAVTTMGAIVLPNLTVDPVNFVLNEFGKDTTLTGRTVLWEYAEQQIAEAPALGVGSGGFWRYHASPLVQKIYIDFYKGPADIFNFHSAYYEIAVHQGLIGLAMAVTGLLWSMMVLLRSAFVFGTMPLIYFATHMLVVIVRTFTEADFFQPFVIFHMIFWMGAFAAYREWKGIPRR